MKAYDGAFAAHIPVAVLAAIAALVDRELPVDTHASSPPTAGAIAI